MTTDPTARHHAAILDWLSAALTDPDTDEIRLESDGDGRWRIYQERVVDAEKETEALSAYDEALLTGQDRPEKEDPQPYDYGGLPLGYTGCTCPDCLEMEERYGRRLSPSSYEEVLRRVTDSIGDHVDKVLKAAGIGEEEGEVPGIFKPSADDGKVTAHYLRQKYGQAAPDEWWERAGFLTKDAKVTINPIDWAALLGDTEWTATDYGQHLTATFSGKAAEDLLVALYGFLPEDEKGVLYRPSSPEEIQRAKDDLFRPEDES